MHLSDVYCVFYSTLLLGFFEMQVIILLLLTTLLAWAQAGQIRSSSVSIQLQRPRQFLMDVYTRPNRKGLVQHMRLEYERGIR